MKKFLDKIHTPTWLTILLAVVLILRIPSFIEPYSYGDEMIYLTMGEGIRQGVTLYKGIYDNKPPLLYLTAAISGNLFWFKVILAFWNFATIILFWHLAKALFPKKEKLTKIATVLFAILTTIPLLEGNIANAELFMIGPIIAGFLILLTKNLTFKNLFGAGVLFSIATLYKVPAAFDIPAIVVFWLIQSGFKKEKVKEIVKNTAILLFGFATPIILTFVWFFISGALKDYLQAAFLQNVGYLSSFRPGDVRKPFLARNLPLLIRAGMVLGASILLYWKRTKLSKEFTLVCLWLAFGLFAVTLSERPYPHYLIQVVPEISLLLAILFSQRNIEQGLSIIPLGVTFFVPFYFHFLYYQTTPYYLRFIRFAVRAINKEQYFSGWGKNVSRNYEIADFISKSTKSDERIFVTGDSSVIYALSRRLPAGKYAADYHIRDFSTPETQANVLASQKPRFIVFLPEARPFPEITPLLRSSYMHFVDIQGAEVWKFTTLRPRF